jgi:hypothetical protein
MSKKATKDDLIDRYLRAVGYFLPAKQRQDVVGELEEDLRSRIEEREAGLGRALTEEEIADLLKETGHPALLALGFQETGSLIGPRTFPIYWFAVKALVGILAIVQLLVPTVFFVTSHESVGKIVLLYLGFPKLALMAVAWMTVGFVLLDSRWVRPSIERALSGWDPRSLPPFLSDPAGQARSRWGRGKSLPQSIFELLIGTLAGVWWLWGLREPFLVLGPAAAFVGFGPIFYALYVPMMVAIVLQAIVGYLHWRYPHRPRGVWLVGLLKGALDMVILALLVRSGGDWIVGREGMASLPDPERILGTINLAVALGLSVALLIAAVTFAWNYLRPSVWPGRIDGPPCSSGDGSFRSTQARTRSFPRL